MICNLHVFHESDDTDEQGLKNRFWAACREPKKRFLSLAARYWAILELSDVRKIWSKQFEISVFSTDIKFHKDLPPSRVFAYGTSRRSATVPGPTIEAIHNVATHVLWRNYLPSKHILPWDPTIPTATPTNGKGIPTVVHLHGGIAEPKSDGNAHSWFTAKFIQRGPTWSKRKYIYHNIQHPGNLWYHDHAMGLTRVNILAGLLGAYIIRQPELEDPLGLPHGHEFDRPLVVFDRSFSKDGSIYMNSTGDNPSIHPQWQPEYFGDAIIVNGKAWPKLTVQRRKYQIADVIIDFSMSKSNEAILANDAAYPYPSGDPADETNGKVMKFIIKPDRTIDKSRTPKTLMKYPKPDVYKASRTRYIAMHEYKSESDEPTHLLLNGKRYEDPVTEVPKAGSSEVWNVINLTEDNHPLHVHLGLFKTLEQRSLVNVEELKECMDKKNDAVKCNIHKFASGDRVAVPSHERGWKNVFKMMPGTMTTILVRFALIHSNVSYPFDVTAEPGYVYHCHILDHEDNAMMRPLKFTP
ncbi:Leucine permease transcriptional regulator [Ranunculus cassubicifolius]